MTSHLVFYIIILQYLNSVNRENHTNNIATKLYIFKPGYRYINTFMIRNCWQNDNNHYWLELKWAETTRIWTEYPNKYFILTYIRSPLDAYFFNYIKWASVTRLLASATEIVPILLLRKMHFKSIEISGPLPKQKIFWWHLSNTLCNSNTLCRN